MKYFSFKTALIGFGAIAVGYEKDSLYTRHVKYATHAKVLNEHPAFDWLAVVDPLENARQYAQESWGIPWVAGDVKNLPCKHEVEVAVIATPCDIRLSILESFPILKAVIVEKPLAKNFQMAQEFLQFCRERNILVQVNIARRADLKLQELAGGKLQDKIGAVQNVFGLYGNGLRNTGPHMIDLVRMLLGEIESVQSIMIPVPFQEGPIADDFNLGFILYLQNKNISVTMAPVRFSNYREFSLDIWGETGRLTIANEGLHLIEYPLIPSITVQHGKSIAFNERRIKSTGYSDALYNLYDNLASVLNGESKLISTGEEACETMLVIDAIFDSLNQKGKLTSVARSKNHGD